MDWIMENFWTYMIIMFIILAVLGCSVVVGIVAAILLLVNRGRGREVAESNQDP